VLLAGLKLDRLRASPLYQRVAALDPVRDASYLLITSDGRSLVWIARGDFRQAPAGATLLGPNLAISGPADAVRNATAQHAAGNSGAPDLLEQAAPLAGSADIWAVIRGGIALPLAGNAANVNRILKLIDYGTLTVRLGSSIDVEITGICHAADAGERLEETVRAIVSLAEAANPRLAAALKSVQIRREGTIVHATLATDADSVGKLIDEFMR
jgi:hypothetical protein